MGHGRQPGHVNAIQNKFPASRLQRCIKHKMNVLDYVPHKQQESVRSELKAIFYQESCQQAEQVLDAFIARYENVYPSAIACLRRDLDACLTFYDSPKEHWRDLRTANVIERLFNEVKQRSHKMATAFHNQNTAMICN